VRASRYQTLLRGKDIAAARTYSPQNKYLTGEVIQHPSFGLGVTTSIKDETKIEVLFEGGLKVLVHGK
jgi:hypothetical protein